MDLLASTDVTPTPVPTVSPENGLARPESVFGLPILSAPWVGFLEIDPTRAERLLTFNTGNRDWKPANVEHFKHLIKSGQFATTHQGLAFDREGALIDGQHRLKAVVATGVTVIVQVNFGMPVGTFGALDRGRARNLADDLVIAGISHGYYATVLQSATRILFHLDAGRLPWNTYPQPTLNDARVLQDRHPFLVDSSRLCSSRVGSPRVPPGPTAAFVSLFREVDDQAGCRFFEQVLTGAALDEGHPVLVFRNAISRDTGNRKTAFGRNGYMIRLVRAWNNVRDGRTVASLSGALRDEKFPEIAGYRKKVA